MKMAKCIPLYVHGKDNRYFDGKCPFWMPWQEAIGARGLVATAKVTGSERYYKLADRVIENCLTHGWWKVGDRWHVGAAIRHDSQEPLTEAQYLDPDWAIDERGTDFLSWSWPVVTLAIERFPAHVNEPLHAKAIEIDAYVRGMREGATGYDRAGEWAYTPSYGW